MELLSKIFTFFILLFSSNTNINSTDISIATSTILESNTSIVQNINENKPIDLENLSFAIYPKNIIQGDPIMVEINSTSSQKVFFNQKEIPTLIYNDKTLAFIGTDIRQKVGDYKLEIFSQENKSTSTIVKINPRPKKEAPLGIPEKLGGNTKESQDTLVKTLAKEADTLNSLISTTTRLWTEKFSYPTRNPFITDDYGYSRQTGNYEIAHKGTDFRAPIGTEVMAMNDGLVVLIEESRNYGKTIVVDHGMGIMTIYLHLSEYKVNKNNFVKKGEIIGLSGMTGYAESPHLHLSIKIGGLSIDPVTFLNFFK